MSTDLRVFTLEAVNALVPRLCDLVKDQLERRSRIEKLLAELGKSLGDVPDTIVLSPSDTPDVRTRKRELVTHIERYRAGWREVEKTGAVLKDAKLGLLDFYGNVDGKLVWLCWRYPEKEIRFYHALSEGFSARKPILADAKSRLLN